jgi:short-subunit dehydrogenase involved in D-alanine esterification of teichoic acids
VINFLPVDCSKYTVDTDNVDPTHELAFESCLLISQGIIKRETSSKDAHLVFVTSGVVTIPQHDHVVVSSDTFPWSASLFGFRRTFREEVKTPSASVVDLPSNPSDEDFQALVEDVRKPVMEEEVVYRNGVRYANRIADLAPGKRCCTKATSPFTKKGEQQPFRMAGLFGQWFLQTLLIDETNERGKIEVYYACPVLQKRWKDLEMNDRVAFAGKLSDGKEEKQASLVAGVCKVHDLGSHIGTDKCYFTEMNSSFTAQQAASLSFPIAISYHIFSNLLGAIKGKRVLIYNPSEEMCCTFACVAMSLDIKVVCVAKNQSSKERMQKFESLVAISESEFKAAELNHIGYMDLDAALLFSKRSTYITHQIMKHLKPGARVIMVNEEKDAQFNPFINEKNAHCVMTNLENILNYFDDFPKSLFSCCSVLQSRNLLGRLLEIPQLVTSIYDAMNDSSMNEANDCQTLGEIGFRTVSFKPTNIPEKVDFYSLPLDDNGFKRDRTYLVIGGVRGFGFEFAKWLVENGAKTVLCTSRSVPSAEKKALVRQLEEKNGSRILLRQADATSSEDMNLIKKELEGLPAVAGIAFTAMVLEDQLLVDADLAACKKVIETKVKGKLSLKKVVETLVSYTYFNFRCTMLKNPIGDALFGKFIILVYKEIQKKILLHKLFIRYPH